MTTLEKKLLGALQRLGIDAGATVIVAVSGGADSTALLDAMVRLRDAGEWPGNPVVAHLNHRLRGEESDGDEQFVRDLAGRYGLPVCIDSIDIAAEAVKEHRNLEATARKLRYRFLLRCARDNRAELVFTAHTRDDQAETLLMRMIRGSGPAGLRGIHDVRNLGEGVRLARPLLDVSRSEVLAHCDRYGLGYRTDSSNYLIDLTRNRVRHELVPMLRSFNPRIDETLIREADLLVEENDFLDQIAGNLLDQALEKDSLRIDIVAPAHQAIRRRVVRLWLNRSGEGLILIEMKHIEMIEDLMLHRQSGRMIDLPGDRVVLREFDRLVLKPTAISTPSRPLPVVLDDGTPQTFGDYILQLMRDVSPRETEIKKLEESGCLVQKLKTGPDLTEIRIRARKPGDSYIPRGARHRIKLKKLMIRHKIPCSGRDTYPLLVTADDSIIWSPGLPVAAQFDIGEAPPDNCILVIARPNPARKAGA